MEKLSRSEMETFQGGRDDSYCGIKAAVTVVGGALGILMLGVAASPFAVIGVGLAYANSMHTTLKACKLI